VGDVVDERNSARVFDHHIDNRYSDTRHHSESKSTAEHITLTLRCFARILFNKSQIDTDVADYFEQKVAPSALRMVLISH